MTPKSWPPGHGDLVMYISFFARRTERARFGDVSSFKEHGLEVEGFQSFSYRIYKQHELRSIRLLVFGEGIVLLRSQGT